MRVKKAFPARIKLLFPPLSSFFPPLSLISRHFPLISPFLLSFVPLFSIFLSRPCQISLAWCSPIVMLIKKGRCVVLCVRVSQPGITGIYRLESRLLVMEGRERKGEEGEEEREGEREKEEG